VYEAGADGVRAGWGRVLAWEPPRRLLLSWHPGRPEAQAQEVEVLFVADGTGTRVELEHRDWQKLAGEAESVRGDYAEGWAGVMQRYARATAP
jgi:uncharacterized protein YndB with AHSA1/START domain